MSRYSVVEIIVGVLVSVAVIAMGSFVINRFSHKVRFYNGCHTVRAYFPDVDGLRAGSDVRVSGVSIGSVISLRLSNDNVPVVEMCLRKGIKLPTDSSASIAYADLLGKRYVDVILGSDDTLIAEGGQFKHTSSTASLHAILGKFIDASLNKGK